MLTVSPFLAFQHVLVNVRNEGVGVHDALMDLRNSHMCIYRKFGLGMKS